MSFFATLNRLHDEAIPALASAKPTLSKAFRKADKARLFTPYENGIDLGVTLAFPIVAPIVLSVITAIAAVATAIILAVAALAALGSLALAGVAALSKNKEVSNGALVLAEVSGLVAGIATAATVLCAFLTAISLPFGVVNALTRSASTISSKCQSPENNNAERVFSPM